MVSEEQCWKARERRDPSFDGRFFIGVVTTGIYCRPSCPSRRALRRNIRFYQTAAEAEKAGLRPCLRCRPLESPSAAIQDLCRYIEQHSAEPLDLAALAAHAGLSRFHLQRTFKLGLGAPRSMRSTPSGAGTLGNLRQGPQCSVDRRRVRKQVGNFGVKDNNV